MKSIFIHIWVDNDGDELIYEHKPIYSFDEAIEEYKDQEGVFSYIHTLCFEPEPKGFRVIDIRDYIDQNQTDIAIAEYKTTVANVVKRLEKDLMKGSDYAGV